MDNREILLAINKSKVKTRKPEKTEPEVFPENRALKRDGTPSKFTIEELNGRPLHGKGHPGYYDGKKYDGAKFIEGANAYLNTRGVNQIKAAKIAGMSTPTFVKYMNKLLIDGRLDGSIFLDGKAVEFDMSDNSHSNESVWNRITR